MKIAPLSHRWGEINISIKPAGKSMRVGLSSNQCKGEPERVDEDIKK